MKQFNVTGMSCAACSARVEKAVQKVPGVTACSVSLLTQFHGRGRHGGGRGHPLRGAGGGLRRRLTADESSRRLPFSGGGPAGGPRYPRFEETPVVVAGFSDRIDVFFYGPYDVGLAAAGLLCRTTTWPWAFSRCF